MTTDEITEKIHDAIDQLTAQYDARLVALVLMARSAGLYNAVRQHGAISEAELEVILTGAVEIILDDNMNKPALFAEDGNTRGRVH